MIDEVKYLYICFYWLFVYPVCYVTSLFKTFVQLQSWIVVAESVWLTQPKIFTIKPFIGQVILLELWKLFCCQFWVGFDWLIFLINDGHIFLHLWKCLIILTGCQTPRVWNFVLLLFLFSLENFWRFSPEMQSNYLTILTHLKLGLGFVEWNCCCHYGLSFSTSEARPCEYSTWELEGFPSLQGRHHCWPCVSSKHGSL